MLSIVKGTLIAGKYELRRRLAQGGMGAVWVAHHVQLDAPVAIKFMDPVLAESDEARGRFELEARTAAQIRSAHIVPVLDYGIADGTPYLVMELLDGEDLETRLSRVDRLPLEQAVDVVAQVARGLRRAHEAGIVHRDLKPANIFISKADDVDTYRVVDFGIAKAVNTAGMTRVGQMLGSPLYMSPEQARCLKTIDLRTDLWSLAVIAYCCVTGQLPFPGENAAIVLLRVTSAEPAPPPSRHVPELPRALDAFFERALAKNPDERFQTAQELAAAFAEAAGIRPPARGGSAPVLESPSPVGRWKTTVRMDDGAELAKAVLAAQRPAFGPKDTIKMADGADGDELPTMLKVPTVPVIQDAPQEAAEARDRGTRAAADDELPTALLRPDPRHLPAARAGASTAPLPVQNPRQAGFFAGDELPTIPLTDARFGGAPVHREPVGLRTRSPSAGRPVWWSAVVVAGLVLLLGVIAFALVRYLAPVDQP